MHAAVQWSVAQAAMAADCTVADALDAYPSRATPPSGATCTTYLTAQSDTGVSCFWTYPYRDHDVAGVADRLLQDIMACRPGERLDPDRPVNHPDSYALRQWRAPRRVYAVSVKDKAARGETLVFVRAEPR